MSVRILISIFLILFPLSALFPQVPDSLRSQFASLADTAAVRQLNALSKTTMYANPTRAAQYADLAVQRAEALPDWLPQANLQRGVVDWVNSAYAPAIERFEKARVLAQAQGDSLTVAKANNNMGLVYFDLSNYELALQYSLAALTYFESQDNPMRIATVRMNLGNIYNRNSDTQKAEEYYRKALDVFVAINDTNSICMVYNNLGLLLRDDGRTTEAIQQFQTALDGYRALGSLYGQSKILTNMAVAYATQERFTEAESLHLRSYDIALQLQNAREVAISTYNLGEHYRKAGDFKRAITSMQTALDSVVGTGDLLLEATTHHGLSDAHERIGQFEQSLMHFKVFKEFNDSIFNSAKAKSLAEMQVQYETELKNKTIENLQQEKDLDRNRKFTLGIALALLLVIGLLVVARQRGVIRRTRALKKKDQEVHAAEAALADAEIKAAEIDRLRLEEELGYKSREITNLAMNIVRRNDLLEVMDRELKALRKGADEKKLKELSLMVSQTLNLEKERQEFQLFVQEAQQNFFLKLEVQFPALSQKEKRLCAMIKLGLSSKEIAAVFNIATSSVEVARYRLRKKLELTNNESLKAFLEGF